MTTITLRQAQKLLAFFGGQDCEVTITEQSQDGAGGTSGLYAHCTEYPEEGCKYLGPTEVDGEIAGADFERMFGAAAASLAEISEALGIDEEEAACANGNELILERISAMRHLSLCSSQDDTMTNYPACDCGASAADIPERLRGTMAYQIHLQSGRHIDIPSARAIVDGAIEKTGRLRAFDPPSRLRADLLLWDKCYDRQKEGVPFLDCVSLFADAVRREAWIGSFPKEESHG